jgi:hypothetical protein
VPGCRSWPPGSTHYWRFPNSSFISLMEPHLHAGLCPRQGYAITRECCEETEAQRHKLAEEAGAQPRNFGSSPSLPLGSHTVPRSSPGSLPKRCRDGQRVSVYGRARHFPPRQPDLVPALRATVSWSPTRAPSHPPSGKRPGPSTSQQDRIRSPNTPPLSSQNWLLLGNGYPMALTYPHLLPVPEAVFRPS